MDIDLSPACGGNFPVQSASEKPTSPAQFVAGWRFPTGGDGENFPPDMGAKATFISNETLLPSFRATVFPKPDRLNFLKNERVRLPAFQMRPVAAFSVRHSNPFKNVRVGIDEFMDFKSINPPPLISHISPYFKILNILKNT